MKLVALASCFCSLLVTLISVPVAHGQVAVFQSDFVGARQPQLAVSPNGDLFVAFGKEHSVYVSKSVDDGKSFGKPVLLGALDKLALGMRRGPRIVASDKWIAVSAISHADGQLVSWTSTDGGATWSEAIKVNDAPKSAREGLHAMVGNAKGDLFATWLDLRNQHTELWGSRSSDGGKTWTPNTRVYQSPDKSICECCHPSAIFIDDRQLVVSWRNWLKGNRDMYEARSVDSGKTFGPATKLGTGAWALKGCPMDGGGMAVSSNDVVHVWRRENRLYASSPGSPEILLSSSGKQPVVLRGKTGLEFLWQDAGGLQRKAEGAAESQLFAPGGSYASVARSPKSGRTLVAWETGTPERAMIYVRELR